MFTDDEVFVIGVDTHRDTHAYAVTDRVTGQLIDQFTLPADAGGYRQARRRAADTGGDADGSGRLRSPRPSPEAA